MPLCEYIMFAFQEKSYHWIEDWGLHTLGIAPDPGGYTSQRARIHDRERERERAIDYESKREIERGKERREAQENLLVRSGNKPTALIARQFTRVIIVLSSQLDLSWSIEGEWTALCGLRVRYGGVPHPVLNHGISRRIWRLAWLNLFLDAPTHLFKRVCPSVRRSVRP